MEKIRTQDISLDEAIEVATLAHSGQVDKAGNPFISHPLTVMDQLRGEETRIAAVLHDVVENTSITFKKLEEAGCSSAVISALKLVTHPKNYGGTKEEYLDGIQAIADSGNKIAIDVKWDDLNHNSDPSRTPNPQKEDFERLKKYEEAKEILKPFISDYLKKK